MRRNHSNAIFTLSVLLTGWVLTAQTAVAQYATTILADNPLAYYRLGEVPGSTAAVDSSVNAHSGFYEGSPTLGVKGLITGSNTAVDFTSGDVIIPGAPFLNFAGSPFTIEAWVKPTSFASGPFMRIFDNIPVNSASGYGLDLMQSNIRLLGSNPHLLIPFSMTANSTYYIVAVSNGSGTGFIYVNGVLIGSGPYQSSSTSATSAHIGVNTRGFERFFGVIDEVAVYNYALSAGQILAHYEAGQGCQVPPPDVTSFPGTPFSRDGKPLSINATFAPKDLNGMPIALSAKAASCNFIGFNWQQEVVSLPSPSPYFPLSPSAINPANLSTNGSLQSPPFFLDPPQGDGYILQNSNGQLIYDFDDAYPYYWNSNDLANNLYCIPHNPTPIETTFALRFQDCPGDYLLPNGAAIKFHTSLVGIFVCPSQATNCTPGLPAPSTPLWQFNWESTFNGSAKNPSSGTGGVSQLKGIFPIDPSSGTGGVTITSINGVPQTPPSVSCTANPNILWPPNGEPVVVTVSGNTTPGTSALAPGGTRYAVLDEYGEDQPSSSFALGPGGSYSFGVLLMAARNGDDQDGRTYSIIVTGTDTLGNVGSCSAVVTVPHDQGQ